MSQVLQTEPITQLQRNYNIVLERLAAGPVLLLQRSSLAAVMVSPDQWNAMNAELETYRSERRFTKREMEALLAAKDIEARNEPTISHEELKAKLQERYGNAADSV